MQRVIVGVDADVTAGGEVVVHAVDHAPAAVADVARVAGGAAGTAVARVADNRDAAARAGELAGPTAATAGDAALARSALLAATSAVPSSATCAVSTGADAQAVASLSLATKLSSRRASGLPGAITSPHAHLPREAEVVVAADATRRDSDVELPGEGLLGCEAHASLASDSRRRRCAQSVVGAVGTQTASPMSPSRSCV